MTTPWGVVGVAVTPDGRRAVLNGNDGFAVLDLTTMSLLSVASLLTTDIAGLAPNVAISDDGRYAALGRMGEVVLVDLQMNLIVSRQAVPVTVITLAFTHDASTLVVGNLTGGHLDFLSVPQLEPVAPRRLVTSGRVVALAASTDGHVLACMGGDGDLTLWDPGDLAAVRRPDHRPERARTSLHHPRRQHHPHPVRPGLRQRHRHSPRRLGQGRLHSRQPRPHTEEDAIIRPGQAPRPTCRPS